MYKKKITINIFCIITTLICLGIALYSCSNDEELNITDEEYSLNLKAPSGELIAANIENLRAEVAISIAERYGIDRGFTITKLDYLPLEKGYSVTISYTTDDGSNENLIMTNSPASYASDNLLYKEVSSKRLKSTSESGGGSVKFYCENRTGCTTCQATAVYQGGVVTYNCGSCNNCSLVIVN